MQPITLDLADCHPLLPRRNRFAHKGNFGHVLVVGGDRGMPGAARLTGEAALRSGAGLVSVATRPEHINGIVAGCPELMVHPIENVDDIIPLLHRATVVALGPGLSASDWSRGLIAHVIASQLPCICDAGAFDELIKMPLGRDNWILTPHPGEAARLLGVSVDNINQDRIAAIGALQRTYGGTIVLKGAGTLVLESRDNLYYCPAGNPGMCSGGMGDVLTGLLAGLVAQHLSMIDAARCGVMLHAVAADMAAMKGERGLIASDLFSYFPLLLNPTN